MSLGLVHLILVGMIIGCGYVLVTRYNARKLMKAEGMGGSHRTEVAWQQVVADYGRYIERNPVSHGTEIRDVTCLPHPKHDIKQALIAALLLETNEPRSACLKVALLGLADFQEGVGLEPLHALGCDVRVIKAALESGTDKKAMVAKVADNPNRQRYEHFQELANKEWTTLTEVIAKTTTARQQLAR